MRHQNMKIIQLNKKRNSMARSTNPSPYILVQTLSESKYYSKWSGLRPKAMFEFALPEDVKDTNEKYCVYVHVYEDLLSNDNSYKFLPANINTEDETRWLSCVDMPKHIWQDSGKGKVLWIVDWSTENHTSPDKIDISMLPDALNIRNNEENLIVLTGTELRFKDINKDAREYCDRVSGKGHVLTYDSLSTFLDRQQVNNQVNKSDFVDKKTKSILDGVGRQYYSVCYNRVPRRHRSYIISHMKYHGYLDKCNYSLGVIANSRSTIHKRKKPTSRLVLDNYIRDLNLDKNINDAYLELREQSKDKDGIEQQINTKHESVNLDINPADVISVEQSMHNYFHVVTETMSPDNDASPTYQPTFITEKSYKPFLMLQPFIAFGSKDNLLCLQHKGFDVFDKWIDVSYDSEADEGKRLVLFLRELDRLHNMSHTDWKKLLIEMLPSILHNFYNYLNYDANDILIKISTIAIQFKLRGVI